MRRNTGVEDDRLVFENILFSFLSVDKTGNGMEHPGRKNQILS